MKRTELIKTLQSCQTGDGSVYVVLDGKVREVKTVQGYDVDAVMIEAKEE